MIIYNPTNCHFHEAKNVYYGCTGIVSSTCDEEEILDITPVDADEAQTQSPNLNNEEASAVIPDEAEVINPTNLPSCLSSEDGLRMLNIAVEQGGLDSNFYPRLSRTKSAVLAYYLANKLKIDNMWQTFELFWKRNNMRQDYNDALDQIQYAEFQDQLKFVYG